MACGAIGCDAGTYYDWWEELRQAVLDFQRGIITLAELVELAGGQRP